MTIPEGPGAMPGWTASFPDGPRARLEQSIGELREQFPYPEARFPIEDAALGRLRLEDAAASRESYRKMRSARATYQWEGLRALEIEEQAARLMTRPAATVRLLETSLPGIRWLLEKWGWLVLALEKLGEWDGPMQTQAQRLCGVPAAFEPADPRKVREGTLEERLELARGEIARLEALLTPEMAVSHAADQQAAIDGTDVPEDATYRRLVGYERDARRTHNQAMAQLNRLRERYEADRELEEGEAEVEVEADDAESPGETARRAPRSGNRKAGRRARRRRRSRTPGPPAPRQ